jgi:hypothetical protein
MVGKRAGTDGTDIVAVLRRDHTRMRSLLTCTAAGDAGDRWATFCRLSDLVIRHEVAEQLVVHPELLGLRGGAAVSGSRLDDEAGIEELLVALDRQQFESPGFQKDAVRLGLRLLGHLEMEDAQVLPLLATRVGSRGRARLGRRFLDAMETVPARHGGAGVPTGPAIVDRTTAVSTFMRDAAAPSELAC